MTTVVTSWDGAKASALRLALRLTVDELADRIGGSSRGVAKWDHQPDLVPTMASQRDLDLILSQASPDEHERFTLLLREQSARPALNPAAQPQEAALARLDQPTAGSGLITLSGGRGGLISPTSETLVWFEENLRNQYTTDNMLGPRALMPPTMALVETIEQMQQAASGHTLDRLLRIGAGYAEFTGWLHHDAGDLRGAGLWASRALEWAHAGGDDRMTSFVLMRRAAAALTARSGAHAVRYAQAAQRLKSDDSGRVRIIAAVTEAHGHAISGDGSEVDRTFDAAEELLARYGGDISDGDPTADRYCEPDLYVRIARAKCALELGRATPSVEGFKDVIDHLPADYHRDRGQYLGSLARAHILAEQPEAAVLAAEEAYGIAVATGSARTLEDLRTSMPAGLARWSHIPEVERFCGMLASVQPENGGT